MGMRRRTTDGRACGATFRSNSRTGCVSNGRIDLHNTVSKCQRTLAWKVIILSAKRAMHLVHEDGYIDYYLQNYYSPQYVSYPELRHTVRVDKT